MEFGCFGVFALVALGVAIAAIHRASKVETELAELSRTVLDLRNAVRDLRRDRSAERPRSEPIPKAGDAPAAASAPESKPAPAPVAAPAPPRVTPPPVQPPAIPGFVSPYLQEKKDSPPTPAAAAPPPPPPRRPPAEPPAAPPPRPPFDWESLIGVKLFSWIGAVAAVLGVVFFLKWSVEHGWIGPPVRAALGILTGTALLVVCELRFARNYRTTANALDGAGIAILYATLFATHALWHLLPVPVVFALMLIVTAIAVALSIRRDSVFIALLGLLGGFATPALLSTGENRPIALFSYLLMLNAGLAWVAYRKRWPALTMGSLLFTVLYQWVWVAKFLDASQLPLAAGIFAVFALAGSSALWLRRSAAGEEKTFERVGMAAAMLPLLFALFAAAVPAYGARYNTLFGFLLLLAAGLLVIAWRRRNEGLHAAASAAVLLTFVVWVSISYSKAQAWPGILGWLAAFVLLFLIAGSRSESPSIHTGAALLFLFPVLAAIEPRAASPAILFGTLFALLGISAFFAVRYQRGLVYFIACGWTILTEGIWSAKHLTPERLTQALLIYAAFGLFFIGVPAIARRRGRALRPEGGVAATVGPQPAHAVLPDLRRRRGGVVVGAGAAADDSLRRGFHRSTHDPLADRRERGYRAGLAAPRVLVGRCFARLRAHSGALRDHRLRPGDTARLCVGAAGRSER